MTGAALPGPALLFCPADRPDRYRDDQTDRDALEKK